MAKIGVIGAGSWGTALAVLLVNNGHDTVLWSHREEQVRSYPKPGSTARSCQGFYFRRS